MVHRPGEIQFFRGRIKPLRLAVHATEAELRAWESNLNPPLVFNSVNSLQALIDEDPTRARQTVTQLANRLYHLCQNGVARIQQRVDSNELRIVVVLPDSYPRPSTAGITCATDELIEPRSELVRKFMKTWLETVG